MSREWLSRLGLAFLLVNGPVTMAQSQDPERGWESTSIDFRLITYFLATEYPCYQSGLNLLGCVRLINGLGRFTSPQIALVPKEIGKRLPSVKFAVRRDFGAFVLAEIETWGLKSGSRIQDARLLATREEEFKAAAASQRLRNERIDFELLALEVSNAKTERFSRQFVLGHAVNSMIEVHDGHGRLVVTKFEKARRRAPDEGIGITLYGGSANRVAILAVDAASPADRAGLKPSDIVLQVNGTPATGQNIDDLQDELVSEEGRMVTVSVERDGQVLPEFSVPSRGRNVSVRYLNDMGAEIAVLKIRTFRDDRVCAKVETELKRIRPDALGLILDLRRNSGGLLDQSTCIAGLFLGRRLVVSEAPLDEFDATGTRTYPHKSRKSQVWLRPLVVEIDSESASASEILAGAIQDYGRGYLVGTRSFGKATIQDGRRFEPFPELTRFATTSRFFLPSGRTNQIDGIEADFIAYDRPAPNDEEKFAMREGDLFPAALPHVGAKWTQPRGQEVGRLISNCLNQARSEAIYLKSEKKADFQILIGQEVLACQEFAASPAASSLALVP